MLQVTALDDGDGASHVDDGVSDCEGEEPRPWSPDLDSDCQSEGLNVEDEYREGQDRLGKARQLLHQQSKVLDRIHAQLASSAVDDSSPSSVPLTPGDSPRLNATGTQLLKSAGSWMPDIANADHQAAMLGTLIVDNRFKFRRIQNTKRGIDETHVTRTDKLAKVLDDGAVRADNRIACRMRDSERKAFMSAQRRSEQQKVRRELLREQERVWENWYAKFHPEVKRKHSPKKESGGVASKMESASDSKLLPQLRKTTREQETPAYADEEIFKSTSKSHAMYAERIESWKQFVTENERRTAAYWQKTLGPDYATFSGARPPQQIIKRQGSRLPSRMQTKELSSFPSEVQAELQSASNKEKLSPNETKRRSANSFTRERTNSRLSGGANSDGLGESWRTTLERCAENLRGEAKEQEKQWSEMQDRIAEHRRRNAEFHDSIRKRCGMKSEQWRKKNNRMSIFRQSLADMDKGTLDKKMADFKDRRDIMIKHRSQSNMEKSAARNAHIRASVVAAKMAQEVLAKQRLEDQAQKDMKSGAHYQRLLKGAGIKTDDSHDDDNTESLKMSIEERKKKKRELENQVKMKAKQEVDKKEGRLAKKIAQDNASFMDQVRMHKETKRNKARPISGISAYTGGYSTDEALTDLDIANDSSHQSPCNDADASVRHGAVLPVISIPTFHEAVMHLSFRSGLSESSAVSAQDATTRSLLACTMPGSTKSEDCLRVLRDLESDVKHLESSARKEALARSARNHEEDGDDSDDGEFIKGLEARSAKWLKDMRQKIEESVTTTRV